MKQRVKTTKRVKTTTDPSFRAKTPSRGLASARTCLFHAALATAAGVIEDATGANRLVTTQIGKRLFEDGGLDPYMENPATSWLVHWHLCGRSLKTTWFWAFNHYSYTAFERETLVENIGKLAKECNWHRASPTTIKNDVACFVRTYVAQLPSGKAGYEDGLESPLTELGLIKPIGKHGGFRFVRGQKPSLGMGVFCYAVTDFWARSSFSGVKPFVRSARTRPAPLAGCCSEENDVVDLLSRLEVASGASTAGRRRPV